MHFLAISLLTLLAGTLLLAKFKKEEAGKFLSFMAWFFIVVGFLLFAGFVAGGICKASHHGFWCDKECNHEMMMHGDYNMMMDGDHVMMKDCKHDMRGDGCMHHGKMIEYCPKHMEGDSLNEPQPEE